MRSGTPRARPPSASEMAALAGRPDRLRNVCVLGHIDHGKSSLVDWLVAENGTIPSRLAGQLRYMDDHPDEQERGITMRASAISIVYKHKGPRPRWSVGDDDAYLATVVDSPGHVDFSYDVGAAARVCDGGLVVVDVVEGLRVQTLAALKFVKHENLSAVLVINKVDRLARGETAVTPAEAYERIARILELANAKSDGLFSFEKGNVVLASAKDGWAATLPQAARHLSQSLYAPKDKVLGALAASDVAYVAGKFVKRLGKHAQAPTALATLFLQPIIWSAYCSYDDDDDAGAGDDKNNNNATALINLRSLFPLARALFKATVENVPPPSPERQNAKCAYVAKVILHEDALYAFARNEGDQPICKGDRMKVLTEEDESMLEVEIDNLYAMMGGSVLPVDVAEPGRIFAFGGGLPMAMGCAKRAIVVASDFSTTIPSFPASFSQPPFLKVAVSAASRRDEVALDRGLALLRQLDAAAIVSLDDRGDRILGCVGELHLDQCLRDLRERYAKVNVISSPPTVGFREGVVAHLDEDDEDDAATARLPPQVSLPPWRDEITDEVELVRPGVAAISVRCEEDREVLDLEVEARPLDIDETNPEVVASVRGCVLVAVSDEVVVADPIIAGFKLAVETGPLADEPLHAVRFDIRRCVLVAGTTGDTLPLGALMTAAKRCCRAALLSSRGLRVFEPVLECELHCAFHGALGKMYALLSKRRGKILQEQYGDNDDVLVTVLLPAIETIGFAKELMQWTSGAATAPSMRFDGYRVDPEDPFWQPTTLDEREEHGDVETREHNRSRKLINEVRRRKGLPTELRVVQSDAEKIKR